MLDKFSMLIAFTRQKAMDPLKNLFKISQVEASLQRGKGSSAAAHEAPPPLFLDIGAMKGLYQPDGLTANASRNHPDHRCSLGLIPTPNTFYEALHKRLVNPIASEMAWSDDRVWTAHTLQYDFESMNPLDVCGA